MPAGERLALAGGYRMAFPSVLGPGCRDGRHLNMTLLSLVRDIARARLLSPTDHHEPG